MSDKQPITGGDFLIKEVACEDIFTPEEWTEEHIMMRQTSIDYVNANVIPNLDAIDNMQEGLMPSLLEGARLKSLYLFLDGNGVVVDPRWLLKSQLFLTLSSSRNRHQNPRRRRLPL